MSNLSAFLSTIAESEGTKDIGDDGYNVLVGSTKEMPLLFGSYLHHPRAKILLRNDNPHTALDETLISSAAGRYQILSKIADYYSIVLKLDDFSPNSQDTIAIGLIKECKAYDDVLAGRFVSALTKCRSRWASLPGAGYGQRENTLTALSSAYQSFGGSLA